MNRIYFEKCYIAFYWTLEHIFKQSKKPVSPHPFSMCDLLSDMCPFTFETGISADPAAYYDYEEILKEVITESDEESVFSGYLAGKKYLQKYMEEYEYELDDIIPLFLLEAYSFAYDKAGEEKRKER